MRFKFDTKIFMLSKRAWFVRPAVLESVEFSFRVTVGNETML